jgi:toxin ParE1/3/4
VANYKLTEKAAEDFARLYEFGWDTFGYEQAERYTEDMERRLNVIAATPLAYATVDEIVKGCRRSVCGVHSIYYRQCTDYVEIIRILNREDPAKALK